MYRECLKSVVLVKVFIRNVFLPSFNRFDGTKEVTEKEANAHMSTSRNPLRRLSKSAQDLKKRFFSKKSPLRRRNTAGSSKIERTNHNGIEGKYS